MELLAEWIFIVIHIVVFVIIDIFIVCNGAAFYAISKGRSLDIFWPSITFRFCEGKQQRNPIEC